MKCILGDAIKCYDCKSTDDSGCENSLTSTSPRMSDCNNVNVYLLFPIEYCHKVKSKGDKKMWFFIVRKRKKRWLIGYFHSTENGEWVYNRGCYVKESLHQQDGQQIYLCNTDYCNSGHKQQPAVLLILAFASLVFFKLLRFWDFARIKCVHSLILWMKWICILWIMRNK